MRYIKSQQRSNEDVVEQVILDMSGNICKTLYTVENYQLEVYLKSFYG